MNSDLLDVKIHTCCCHQLPPCSGFMSKKKKDESKKLPIPAAGNIAQPHCVKKLLCDHHPVLQISQTDFYAQIRWANRRLSPCFGQWDSFRVPPDCAVLLLVTVWRWVFDCGSLEWISGDKALVPVRGSHSGPCLLSHFPDKPNCISQECPGPKPCPAWPRRCLGGLQWLTPSVVSPWCGQIGWYSRDTWVNEWDFCFFVSSCSDEPCTVFSHHDVFAQHRSSGVCVCACAGKYQLMRLIHRLSRRTFSISLLRHKLSARSASFCQLTARCQALPGSDFS